MGTAPSVNGCFAYYTAEIFLREPLFSHQGADTDRHVKRIAKQFAETWLNGILFVVQINCICYNETNHSSNLDRKSITFYDQ